MDGAKSPGVKLALRCRWELLWVFLWCWPRIWRFLAQLQGSARGREEEGTHQGVEAS